MTSIEIINWIWDRALEIGKVDQTWMRHIPHVDAREYLQMHARWITARILRNDLAIDYDTVTPEGLRALSAIPTEGARHKDITNADWVFGSTPVSGWTLIDRVRVAVEGGPSQQLVAELRVHLDDEEETALAIGPSNG